MAHVGTMVVRALGTMLKAETGMPFAVGAIAARESLPPERLPMATIQEQNIDVGTLEKRAGAKYPSVSVYCERLENKMREKFRTFSGKAHMVMEVRVSHDHISEVEQDLGLYVDAVTQVLDLNRGPWNGAMFYGGGYEVKFDAVKHGGRNYLQTAKVTFSLDVSID